MNKILISKPPTQMVTNHRNRKIDLLEQGLKGGFKPIQKFYTHADTVSNLAHAMGKNQVEGGGVGGHINRFYSKQLQEVDMVKKEIKF